MSYLNKILFKTKNIEKNIYLNLYKSGDILFNVSKNEPFEIYNLSDEINLKINEVIIKPKESFSFNDLDIKNHKIEVYKEDKLINEFYFVIYQENLFFSDFKNLMEFLNTSNSRKFNERKLNILKKVEEDIDSLKKLIYAINVLKNELAFKKEKVLKIKGKSSTKEYEINYERNFDINENKYFMYFLKELINKKHYFLTELNEYQKLVNAELLHINNLLNDETLSLTKSNLLKLKLSDVNKLITLFNELNLTINRLIEISHLTLNELTEKKVNDKYLNDISTNFKKDSFYNAFYEAYLFNEIFDYNLDHFKYQLSLETKRKQLYELYITYTFIALSKIFFDLNFIASKRDLLTNFKTIKNGESLKFIGLNFNVNLTYQKMKNDPNVTYKDKLILIDVFNLKNEHLYREAIIFEASKFNDEKYVTANETLIELIKKEFKTDGQVLVSYLDQSTVMMDQFKGYKLFPQIYSTLYQNLNYHIKKVINQVSGTGEIEL